MAEVRVLHEERRPFFTPASLAEYLGLSKRTVRDMLSRGVIPSYKFEGARRIHADDVDEYVNARAPRRGEQAA